MGDDENVKQFPIKHRKESWTSKSGQGTVVRAPTQEEKNETIKEKSQPTPAESPKEPEVISLKESETFAIDFKIDEIEKQLLTVDKQLSFLARLFGGDSDRYEIAQIKKNIEKLNVKRHVKDAIVSWVVHIYEANEVLLEARDSLLKKQFLTHPEMQKINFEIEFLKRVVEKTQLENTIRELKKGKSLTTEEESLLKDFVMLNYKKTDDEE